jgi:polyisoprenoid-binding protein YceI
MKRTIITGLFIATVAGSLFGQGKFLTNNGQITFFSHTAIEDITADNHAVASVIDSETGDVVIIVKMTEFQFKKKLMQEHFNENYVESEKFPKANFKGTVVNNSEVDYATKGTYKVMVKGDMTIHGKTNELSAEGTIEVISKGIIARTKFMLNPADYDIKIPKVVRKNISERMEVTIELNLLPI